MLCISRKVGERLVLLISGETVATVTVLEVRGPNVRIGVDAPLTTEVWREELVEQVRLNGRKHGQDT